jgi:hypothetical protein
VKYLFAYIIVPWLGWGGGGGVFQLSLKGVKD